MTDSAGTLFNSRRAGCGSVGWEQFPFGKTLLLGAAVLLPAAVWTSSPRAEIVFLRHVPPAQVPVLKNLAFDLMTRSAFIARAPAESAQSAIHRNARRIGKSITPLRSAMGPTTATAPTLGPAHNLQYARATYLAVARHRNGCLGVVDGDPASSAVARRNLASAPGKIASLSDDDS